MSLHVNEYNPTSRFKTNGIQTDPRKLKFNNIQSCIAVVVCAYHAVTVGTAMVAEISGVHLNLSNLQNSEVEVNIAIADLKTKYKNRLVDVYIVGPYDRYYGASRLVQKLRYLQPRTIKLANLAVKPSNGADQDVKFEAAGANLNVSQRECVKMQYGTKKDKYDVTKGGVAITKEQRADGKHEFINDRDGKPWMLIHHFQIL